MGVMFIDGFDHYDETDIESKWTGYIGAVTIGTSSGRHGGALLCNLASRHVWKLLPNTTTFVVGVAIYIGGGIATAGALIGTSDQYTPQVNVRVTAGGKFAMYRGTTLLETSTADVPIDEWFYLELKATIDNTTGSYEVRLNGETIMSGTNVDTQDTANAYVNYLILNSYQFTTSGGVNRSSGNLAFDDLYLLDSSGALNDFLGDSRVDTIFPTGNGNSSGLTNSDSTSTNNYTYVDDSASARDDDTTYVGSHTASTKDIYAFSTISHNPVSIYATQFSMWARSSDGGAHDIAAVVRSGGTDYDGDTQVLWNTYRTLTAIFEDDPYTSAAWTKAGVNAAEFGVKVIA